MALYSRTSVLPYLSHVSDHDEQHYWQSVHDHHDHVNDHVNDHVHHYDCVHHENDHENDHEIFHENDHENDHDYHHHVNDHDLLETKKVLLKGHSMVRTVCKHQ